MEETKYTLKPIEVSEISPVFDSKGCVKEWKLTVVFDKTTERPPHARGASVVVEPLKNGMRATYRFPESVMRRGAEHVLNFKTQILFQINTHENIK